MGSGMFSAVSGIRANQTRLNVISNNIANINTVGFKSSDVNFGTVFATTLSGGSAPTGSFGGTNPKQVGNGVLVGEIPANFSQGGTQFTGRNTDMMINGEGFFVVNRPSDNIGSANTAYYLTRAGNFKLDSTGALVTASGSRVRGSSQLAGANSATSANVQVPQELIIVKDFNSATGTIVGTQFAQVGTSTAAINAAISLGADTQSIVSAKLVSFTVGTDGAIVASYSNGDRITVRTDAAVGDPSDPTTQRRQIIHLPSEGGTFAANNQTGTDNGAVSQLNTVFADGDGNASMEGMQLQLQTATVTNPAGLLFDGQNNYLASANSGDTNFGIPGNQNRGTLQVGALESSNVDLAGEFSNLIISQRGLEANGRVIRAQSEVLQSVINIV